MLNLPRWRSLYFVWFVILSYIASLIYAIIALTLSKKKWTESMDFREVIKENCTVSSPLYVNLRNKKLADGYAVTMQDILYITRLLKRYNCKDSITFAGDLKSSVVIEFDGKLMRWSAAMNKHNFRWGLSWFAFKELLKRYDVYCHFKGQAKLYHVDENMQIKNANVLKD